jgi:hypothetical protein
VNRILVPRKIVITRNVTKPCLPPTKINLLTPACAPEFRI